MSRDRSNSLHKLIDLMSRLPGFGPRSARRIVLHLLNNRQVLDTFLHLLLDVKKIIVQCDKCRNLDIHNPCSICLDEKRDHTTICVVENVGELWIMEKSGAFNGVYHVLGGLLSNMTNTTPARLGLDKILDRISEKPIQEVIMAVSATLEGQTTAYYVASELSQHNVKISRLAFGIPVGGELEYVDENTLKIALKARQEVI